MAAGEQVVVLQQVGLEGEDLLHAQAQLLVPRPGQAQGLVPGRQLHGAGAGVLGEGDCQHLQHDPGDVVLRLRFREAQGVYLHAVAEPPHLRVGHAVAVAPQLIPQLPHRPQLGDLVDEADAGVDEEGDPPEDRGEHLIADRVPPADLIEHRGRGGHGVGDLLHGCRADLLQVVAADVDRVPLGHLLHRERHDVGGQPQRFGGPEDVGAAGEVLLDDVVLRRAGEGGAVGPLLLRDGDVERQQPCRRGVDRHRRVHLCQRDPVEQRPHVVDRADRHADLADLPPRQHVVGVVAGLRGQVEGDGQAGLPLGEVGPVQLA